MNVLYLKGQIVDLNEILAVAVGEDSVALKFRNGDNITLHWRDMSERADLLRALQTPAAAS